MTRTTVVKILVLALLMPLLPSAVTFADSPEAASREAQPTVFYFHGKMRCSTCRSIEKAAHTVVHERYAKRLEAGELDWQTVNVHEAGNYHYVEDVGLTGSSVVLAMVSPGGEVRRAKILQKVWRLSRDKQRMRGYIAEEIAAYMADVR